VVAVSAVEVKAAAAYFGFGSGGGACVRAHQIEI
jgi:hypothetical protein